MVNAWHHLLFGDNPELADTLSEAAENGRYGTMIQEKIATLSHWEYYEAPEKPPTPKSLVSENTPSVTEFPQTPMITPLHAYPAWSYASYSSLIRQLPEERPDRDHLTAATQPAPSEHDGLPAGPTFGNVIHHIFENFTYPHYQDEQALHTLCGEAIQAYNMDMALLPAIAQLVHSVLCSTPHRGNSHCMHCQITSALPKWNLCCLSNRCN